MTTMSPPSPDIAAMLLRQKGLRYIDYIMGRFEKRLPWKIKDQALGTSSHFVNAWMWLRNPPRVGAPARTLSAMETVNV